MILSYTIPLGMQYYFDDRCIQNGLHLAFPTIRAPTPQVRRITALPWKYTKEVLVFQLHLVETTFWPKFRSFSDRYRGLFLYRSVSKILGLKDPLSLKSDLMSPFQFSESHSIQSNALNFNIRGVVRLGIHFVL